MERSELLSKVRLGWFEQNHYGLPHGVVHVGTNDGYEIEWYLKLGMQVWGFEPLETAFERCHERYLAVSKAYRTLADLVDARFADAPVQLFNFGLGARTTTGDLAVTEGDGCGSTYLEPRESDKVMRRQYSRIFRFEHLFNLKHLTYPHTLDALVVDVQGMELDVLAGFGVLLQHFKYLNVECSREPLYKGEACGQSVIDYCAVNGFKKVFPPDVPEHNDVLFIRA